MFVLESLVVTALPADASATWNTVLSSSENSSTTQTNVLYSVTCVSASDCWAVGYYYNGSYNQTLIEQYNGTGWSIVTSPNSSTTQNNYLESVTCVSVSDCWAVGYYYTGTYYQTLIEQTTNGTSWSIDTSPNTLTTQNNYLVSVTCVSSTD